MSQLPCRLFRIRSAEDTDKFRSEGGRAHRTVRDPPCLAYLDLSEIGRMRREALQPRINRRFGFCVPMPGVSRQRIRKCTPAEPLNDAYIAAVLIALAQTRKAQNAEHGYKSGDVDNITKVGPHRRYILASSLTKLLQVALVLTNWRKNDCLYLYAAKVPTGFCERLNHPNEAYSTAWLEIERQSVSFEPFHSLRQRLVRALIPRLDVPAPREQVCSCVDSEDDTVRRTTMS